MKKIKKLALLLAICMVGTVGLVGCGNDGDSSSKNESSASQTADDNANSADDSAADSKDGDSSASVVGTWTVTALEGTDGTAVSIDDYATANGVDPETLKCTYTFADDGTFSGEMSGVSVSGNYTFEGTDLVMTVGEQQFNYTYDADNDMLKYTDPNTGLSSYCEQFNPNFLILHYTKQPLTERWAVVCFLICGCRSVGQISSACTDEFLCLYT